MLQFTSFKNKEQSNEELGAVLLGTILVGLFILYAYFHGKKDRENALSKDDESKLVPILKKHYPKICEYINTELKDDPFFFKTEHAWMPLVDNCLMCAKERIAKSPKLINMPEPTSSDTIELYDKKLAQYFGNKKFYMEHIDEWDDPSIGMPNHFVGNTYKEGNWLNSNKVCELFSLIPQCRKYDKLIHTKLSRIYNTKLKDEDDEYHTLRESEIMREYIGEEFFADDDSDHSDDWDSGPGNNVDETMYNIVKHLKSYLIQKYGKDKIKQYITKK